MKQLVARRGLVTGGGGLIGAALCAHLQSEGWSVTCVDRGGDVASGNLDAVGFTGLRVIADLCSTDAWHSDLWPVPDVIFHLAGHTSVAGSVADPVTDFTSNVAMTLRMLEYARTGGATTVLLPSTASVYLPGQPMPLSETARLGASSPYGAAKLATESYGLAYARCYGLDVRVVRFFNVYGPRMRQFVIHDLVKKMIANPSTLEVLGDGQQLREYLHADDAARALGIVAVNGALGEVYNAGTGRPVRIRQLAAMIAELLELRDIKIRYTNESWPGDVREWIADTTKIQALGFAPSVEFDKGLADTVRSLRLSAEGNSQ